MLPQIPVELACPSRVKHRVDSNLTQFLDDINLAEESDIVQFVDGLQDEEILIYGLSKLSTWEDSAHKKGYILNNKGLK